MGPVSAPGRQSRRQERDSRHQDRVKATQASEAVADARIGADQRGSRGSGSILRRRFAMCARRVWRVVLVGVRPRPRPAAPGGSSAARGCAPARAAGRTPSASGGSPRRRAARGGRQGRSPARRPRASGSSRRPRAPQRRVEPRDQLARAERLRHVVVGPGLEGAHLLAAPRRPPRAPGSASRSTPESSGRPRPRRRRAGSGRGSPRPAARSGGGVERLLGGLAGDHLEARVAQDHLQRPQDLRLVVADEHAPPALIAPAPPPRAAPRRPPGWITKRRSLAGQRVGADPAAVRLDEAARDREPEPRPRAARPARWNGSKIALELLAGDPRAAVADAQQSASAGPRARTVTGVVLRRSGPRSRARWRAPARAAPRPPAAAAGRRRSGRRSPPAAGATLSTAARRARRPSTSRRAARPPGLEPARGPAGCRPGATAVALSVAITAVSSRRSSAERVARGEPARRRR